MALSRKFLAAMGIDADKIEQIIEAHTETVEALKEERDSYKGAAEKYDKAQKDLDAATKKIDELSNGDTYKVKYDALKEDFNAYKKEIEAKEIKGNKLTAYKALLKEIGIADKRIDAVSRLANLDDIKLDKDGKIEGSDELKKSLTDEWSDFIVKEGKEGASVPDPQKGNKVLKSKEEIMQIKDTAERQKAWADLIRNGGNENGGN